MFREFSSYRRAIKEYDFKSESISQISEVCKWKVIDKCYQDKCWVRIRLSRSGLTSLWHNWVSAYIQVCNSSITHAIVLLRL